jgi:hypothetical protein
LGVLKWVSMQIGLYNGWVVEFQKNVHMYSHNLKLSKDGVTYDVPCEDTPSGFVGIWPYDLKLKVADPRFKNLLVALREWARQSGLRYRLYTSRDKYETNDSQT